ncbi:hypothetical protein ACHAWT_002107 [Skeletonema menzelii]
MPGISQAYENRLRQQREAESRHKQTRVHLCLERMKGYVVGSSPSWQRQPDYSIASSRSHIPPSVQSFGKYDASDNKIDQNEAEMSEILDFYGHDATLYYMLATDERLHEA